MTMTKAIYFDMDGTIADLYAVNDWLPMLRAYDPKPYAQAKPLVNMQVLARLLNRLKANGYHIGIISWLSKESTAEYDNAVTKAKIEWLNKHLKSVEWDEVNIVAYGTPKQNIVTYNNGILFDDELNNRVNWVGTAYDVDNIIEVLKGVLHTM